MENIIDISYSYNVVIFDGPCNLCNKYVDYIIRYDHQDKCRFISLQSDSIREFLNKNGFDTENLSSIIVVSSGQFLIKSRAIFRVLSYMKRPVNYLSYFKYLLPMFISDFFYSIISKYRYSIFGKSDNCRVPSQSELKKFISNSN